MFCQQEAVRDFNRKKRTNNLATSRLNTHKPLYKALKNVVDTKDTFETNAIDDHVAKLFLFDFEQCGIHLEEKQRQKVVYLNDTILQLGQRFMTGAVHPRQVSKSVLPDNIKP